MQCPHCLQHFHARDYRVDLGKWGEDEWTVLLETCPNCNEAVIHLWRAQPTGSQTLLMVYPKSVGRPPLPGDVPDRFARDYREAAALLAESPQVSAALGRRCLRRLLHEVVGIRANDFGKELDTLIASRQLPKYLAEAVDGIRNLGDYATQPGKCTHPGEIQDVGPGEAEWTLDTLDGLFAFYFVQPAETSRRRAALLARVNVSWKNPQPQA